MDEKAGAVRHTHSEGVSGLEYHLKHTVCRSYDGAVRGLDGYGLTHSLRFEHLVDHLVRADEGAVGNSYDSSVLSLGKRRGSGSLAELFRIDLTLAGINAEEDIGGDEGNDDRDNYADDREHEVHHRIAKRRDLLGGYIGGENEKSRGAAGKAGDAGDSEEEAADSAADHSGIEREGEF